MTEEYDGSTELPGKGKDRRREYFCHQYVVDFNGTQAAIRAGYSQKGASVTATRLLADDRIQKRVKYLSEEVKKSVKIDAEWVLQQLVMMVQADLTQIMDPQGNFLDPSDWPEDVKAIIAGFESNHIMDKDGNTGGMLISKVKRTDRLRALELLGKHKGIQAFREQVEVDAGENMVNAILRGRKRARGEDTDEEKGDEPG